MKDTKKNYPKFTVLNVKQNYPLYESVTDINPGSIRRTLESGTNIEIQSLVDTVLKADSHFLGKYQDRLSVIRKASFNWTAPEGKEKFAEEIKAVIEPKLKKNVLRHLTEAVFRRFAVTEILWKKEGNGYGFDLKNLDGKGFEFASKIDGKEEEGDKLYIYDFENYKATDLPQDKAIITYSGIKINGVHISLTEIVAILVVIKYFALQKDWTRFNEIFGLPLLMGTADETASESDIDRLYEALEMIGSNARGVLSGAVKIDIFQPKNNDPKMFAEIIKLCNEEMSKAVLGQSGTSGSGEKSSYASLKVLNGVREDVAQDSLDILADAINERLIKPYCFYNYGMTKDFPILKLELPADYEKMINRDKGLKSLGVAFKKTYFQKNYNLDENDFDVNENQPQGFNPNFGNFADFENAEFENSSKKKAENPFF